MYRPLALATAALLALPAAAAPSDPMLMRDVATAFKQADANNNGQLSREEYRELRMNSFSRNEIGSYHNKGNPTSSAMVDQAHNQSFASLDRDSNGSISAGEFNSIAAQAHSAARSQAMGGNNMQGNQMQHGQSAMQPQAGQNGGQQAWNPDFVTVIYYLQRNPIDTDTLEGKPVTNLKGEKVGEIARIIRAKDDGKHYAMIDIKGSPMYRPTSGMRRDEAGIPLDDVLWNTQSGALMLSSRGEEWLREADAHVVENFEEVDRLYRAS